MSISVEGLIEKGILPSDTEVLSNHNNLVVRSNRERIVARIGELSIITTRDDPGDIAYAHNLSYSLSKVAPIVEPLSEKPEYLDDIIISTFPLRSEVDWGDANSDELLAATESMNDALSYIEERHTLRELNVAQYVHERLRDAASTIRDRGASMEKMYDFVYGKVELHGNRYPFGELTEDSPALVHGDLHAGNFVFSQDEKRVEIIDLDSISKGPRLYDLASWSLRRQLGDKAPVESIVDLAKKRKWWNSEAYRALVGWKAISSMTHLIKYESDPDFIYESINRIGVSELELTG